MLKNYIRVLYSDNGTISDMSLDLSEGNGASFPVVATEDYVYIGQYFPFNNFFIEASTGNASGSVLTVSTWDGTAWNDCVDILDSTAISGATFAKDGVIQFEQDKDKSWPYVIDTSEETGSGLTGKTIYDMYWARLKFSGDFSAGVSIKRLFYAFCDDSHLAQIDPTIDNFLVPWGGSGKTDWNEQIMIASEHVVSDLKNRRLVRSNSQVIRFDDICLATAYKTLSLIMSPLGSSYKDKKDDYDNKYNSLMSNSAMTFDLNNDASLQRSELQLSVVKGVR